MSLSSNSVIAKARAVYGKSLTHEDYLRLCAAGSVSEAAALLKQMPRYETALRDINPQTIHRGQLEALLKKAAFDVFERFHRFDFSDSREFFRYIVMEYEAEQILTAIECVGAQNPNRYIALLPMFLIEHSKVDLMTLGKAQSFSDIARLLEGTPYEKLLRQLLIEAESSGSINIIECERRIYTYYYISAIKTVERLYKGTQRTELKRALLKSVDMENVVTCCRMRTFGIGSDSIKGALLPFKYRLSEEATERILRLDSIEKTECELAKLGYHTDAPAQLDTVEQLTERISMNYLRRLLRMSGNSAAVYYALIESLKIEQRNVKTAIEGIRYGLSSGEILAMLVI